MTINKREIDEVRLQPSDLGGFVVHIIGIDDRTLYFKRYPTYADAVVGLRILGIEPPPSILAA